MNQGLIQEIIVFLHNHNITI